MLATILIETRSHLLQDLRGYFGTEMGDMKQLMLETNLQEKAVTGCSTSLLEIEMSLLMIWK